MSGIVLSDVRKSFGTTEVVRGISYAADEGSFVTMLGPSGCGKSTTLNMIAGLEAVTDGTISIDGVQVEALPPEKRELAFVFQDYALYPHMTVFDNMAFGLKMRRTPKSEIRDRVTEAASRLAIDHLLNRKPRALSGGQRQRVALGRAIVRRPKVFLFDEPLSNLDALMRESTRAEIKRLHGELGATSVYVTHDQEEAMTLSDVIVVLNDGAVEQAGAPEEIYRRPATAFVAGFVGKPAMNLLPAVADGHQVTVPDGGWKFRSGVSATGAVTLGVRPDEIPVSLHETDRPDGATPVTVELTEPVGAATDLTVTSAAGRLTVRAPGIHRLPPGETIWLNTEAAPVHLFNQQSGVRL